VEHMVEHNAIARQLTGSLQEQLQQQRTDATAREARQVDEARKALKALEEAHDRIRESTHSVA